MTSSRERIDVDLPQSVVRNVLGAHGEHGSRWLVELPSLLGDLSREWDLREVIPVRNLSYNYVASALRNVGGEVVLKVGVPTCELSSEIEALRIYDGRGAVRLLASLPAKGALLLERVKPGDPLATIEDDELSTRIAASMMKRIRRPLPADHGLPTLREWGRALSEASAPSNPLPSSLLDRAQKLFPKLLESATEEVLLHGDLHHENVLRAEREPWLIIDPKGLAGDPAYEVGTFLLNPSHMARATDARRIMTRRVDQLSSELSLDRSRVAGWGFVQAMLSACWFVEEQGDGWQGSVAFAELLLGA